MSTLAVTFVAPSLAALVEENDDFLTTVIAPAREKAVARVLTGENRLGKGARTRKDARADRAAAYAEAKATGLTGDALVANYRARAAAAAWVSVA